MREQKLCLIYFSKLLYFIDWIFTFSESFPRRASLQSSLARRL